MIEIYSKNNCVYCDKAKPLIAEKLGNYKEYNIEDEPSRKAELLRRFPHVKTVPQIVINGKLIGGYTDLLKYLEEVGERY